MPSVAPSRSGDAAISAVSKALQSASNAADLKEQIQQLQRYANAYGFDTAQCQHLIDLALCGTTRRNAVAAALDAKPPKPGAAASILKCVVPAPNTRLGSDAVYRVLACLGPNPGTKTEGDIGLKRAARDEDQDETSPRKVGPERIKVDIRVQAAAIRLLSMLLDSPPVPLNLAVTLDPIVEGGEPRQPSDLGGTLPTTFLTLAARTALQRCYGILFHFLDYQALRPSLCYLLCKITKRKHVKHYRITKLMSLRANFNSEVGLSALLSVYANFYPDLLFPELLGGTGGASSVGSNAVPGLKFPENDWLSRVLRCHAKHARRAAGETIESDDEDAQQGDKARPSKRARVSLDGSSKDTADSEGAKLPLAALPNLVTIQPQTSLNKTLGTPPSLITELSSLRHLAHSLDRLTLPSQVASMLAPTFGARLMRVAILSGATITNDVSLSQEGAESDPRASDYCWTRLSDWLESVVRDEIGLGSSKAGADGGSATRHVRLPAGASAHNRLASLLSRAAQTFDAANEIPDRFEDTICQVLRGLADVASHTRQWDHEWDALCSEIVSFVSLTKPRAWDELKTSVIEPLQVLCQAPAIGETAAAAIVEALASMLRRWAHRDWAQISRRLDRSASVRWGISTLNKQVGYFDTISNAASALDELATDVLLRYQGSLAVEHAALSSYETLLGPLAGMHRVYTVPPLAFYSFSYSATSVMPLSRLAGLMQGMRRSHDGYKVVPPAKNAGAHDRSMRTLQAHYFDEVNTTPLNKAVTVLVNFVWRGKAFDEAFDEDAPQLGLEPSVIADLTTYSQERGPGLHISSSITHHPCFVNLSDRFINELCQQRSRSSSTSDKPSWIHGPVTPRLLQRARPLGVPADWTPREYRRALLDWLRDRGMHGLDEFIKNSIRNYHAAAPTLPPAAAADASVSMDA